MHSRRHVLATITLLGLTPVALLGLPQSSTGPAPASPDSPIDPPSARIVDSITEPSLQHLAGEVLLRNPGVAAAEARARAAAQRAPQVKALPDPVAGLTAFLQTPETRTGPQRFSVGLFQSFPWLGKLGLKEQAALYQAMALEAEVETVRLRLVTESRRLFYEIGFLHRYREIAEEYLAHLSQHEEVSRVRYATGVGPGQGVVKIQAEITKAENELLEIETRQVALRAQLNALRDFPASAQLPSELLPNATEVPVDAQPLLQLALSARPELVAEDARISKAEALIKLAQKQYRPDFKLGLTFTAVDPRDDTGGRLQPPEGNGDDIFGIQGAVSLPIWRKKLSAGVEEAVELETAAQRSRHNTATAIQAVVGDLGQRVPLSWRQLRLVEDLLIVQAEESLESAKAGYIAGTLNALDLLDAEHVLFEAQTAAARARADYLVGLAKLEGAIAGPLQNNTSMERSES